MENYYKFLTSNQKMLMWQIVGASIGIMSALTWCHGGIGHFLQSWAIVLCHEFKFYDNH